MIGSAVRIGAISMLLAVALGAFGAHGLEGKIEEHLLGAYETGVQYHIAHSLGLILIGVLSQRSLASKWLSRSAWLLAAGIVLFSGSLYVMALTGISKLGIITPIGGVAFLAGWACLAVVKIKD